MPHHGQPGSRRLTSTGPQRACSCRDDITVEGSIRRSWKVTWQEVPSSTEINSDAKEQSGTEISTGPQRAFGCAKHSPTDIQLDHRHDQTWTNKLLVSTAGAMASNSCLPTSIARPRLESFQLPAARATTKGIWQLWSHLTSPALLNLRIFLQAGFCPQLRQETAGTGCKQMRVRGRSLQKTFDHRVSLHLPGGDESGVRVSRRPHWRESASADLVVSATA